MDGTGIAKRRLAEIGEGINRCVSAWAIVYAFEISTWSHDPSFQLSRLAERFRGRERYGEELARISGELAPEHGRSTYGIPEERLAAKRLEVAVSHVR